MYNLLLAIAAVMALAVLPALMCIKKRRATLFRRLGWQACCWRRRPQPASDSTIWIHALSVGEVLSATALAHAIRQRWPRARIVLSASTQTGIHTAHTHLRPDVDEIRFFPFDLPPLIALARHQIRPNLVLLVETDLWPNFLWLMRFWRIPVCWVNARLSSRSLDGYRRIRWFWQPLLCRLNGIGAQSETDLQRIRTLLGTRVPMQMTGNLKVDRMHPAPFNRVNSPCAQRPPTIVAGSTHGQEHVAFIALFHQLKTELGDLQLIIAPRHCHRADRIVKRARAAGLTVARYSELELAPETWQHEVIVIDRLGILADLYALADVAFVGGSRIDRGGHNPMEPAAVGAPVLFGPFMDDFADLAEALVAGGGAVRIDNDDQLYQTLRLFLKDRMQGQSVGQHARAVFDAHHGAGLRTLEFVDRVTGMGRP